MKSRIQAYKKWRRAHPHGLATFCSHRTHRRDRAKIYRALLPWTDGLEIFTVEPTKAHPLHVDDEDVEAFLQPLIAVADLVFVSATVAANNSSCMPWEVKTARGLWKPTIPVQFDGQNALPKKIIQACGRNAVPSGLLRERALEALPLIQRERFLRTYEPYRFTPYHRA